MSAVSPGLTFTWRHAVIALVVLEALLLTLYFGTAEKMVAIWWRSETFNHAFLVPPISLWLIWEKRRALANATPRPAAWVLVPFAGVAFVWLLGELAAVNAATQFAFVAMLVLAVPLLIGIPAARKIAFPLAFLFFAVPFGEFVMPKLMEWTALFTVAGLRATGIPVYQEGLHFVIPSGRWSVVEACSGVRYLIASIVVGTLFAYLNYQSLRRRLVFIGFSILVPLIANWVRAYLIVMLGHVSGNQLAVGVDHLIYGWVFFGIVIMLMFAIGMRWREHEFEPATAANGVDASPPPPRIATLLLPLVAGMVIAALPGVLIVRMEHASVHAAPALSTEMLTQGGWGMAERPFANWQPAFDNPAARLDAVLAKEDRRIGVIIAYYRQQNYTRKLISSENVIVRSNDVVWSITGRSTRSVRLGGREISMRESVLSGLSSGMEPMRLRIWHVYWIDGQFVSSDALGKLRLAWSRLIGHGDDSAAVFVYTPEPGAEDILTDYLTGAGQGITALLEQAVSQTLTVSDAYTGK